MTAQACDRPTARTAVAGLAMIWLVSVLGAIPREANAGPQMGNGQSGNLAVSGQGRVFLPFAKHHAVQAQGEFMHWLDRDEGQVDLGLVNRWGNVQLGGFSSFKYVKFDEWQQMGGLGQAAFTADYIFNKGRVGFFGTKAFLDGAVVNEQLIRRNIYEQTYLQVVDHGIQSERLQREAPVAHDCSIDSELRHQDLLSAEEGDRLR